MRRVKFLLFYMLFGPVVLFAQDDITDSLTALLNKHPEEDTMRVKLLNQLTYRQLAIGSEKTPLTGDSALHLSRKLNYVPGEIIALERLGNYYQALGNYQQALQFFDLELKAASRIADSISIAWANVFKGGIYQTQSDYPLALQYYLQSLRIFENTGSEKDAASVMGNIGVLYQDMGEPATAQKYYEQGLTIQEKAGNKIEIIRFLNNLGGVYKDQLLLQQAEAIFKRGLTLAEQQEDKHYIALISRNLMDVKSVMKNYQEAFSYGFRSLALYRSLEEPEGVADITYLIGSCYIDINKPDSAIFFASQSLALAKKIGFFRNIHNTYNVLAKAYGVKKDFAKAYQYQQQYVIYKDSLNGLERKNIMAGMKFRYDLDKKQSEIVILTKDKQLKAEEANRQRIKAYAFLVCLLMLILVAIILIRTNHRKRMHNTLLKARKAELQATLTELKSTQAQLIQSEKMASLGELTAGIAHEIQNPLNFVNNFSELNKEMIAEMQEEIDKGNYAEVKLIVHDIQKNEEKINHHGKRADAIVKSMLQHSRAGTGQKELTDINVLCEEYLRLSYHGLHAKNKSFNAEFKMDLDKSIGTIRVVPQDIGRALLNLFNNAFYAVMEKQKSVADPLKGSEEYVPTVTVMTKRLNDKVEITVSDNGNGISQNIIGKIFQPFFTTKPTGQGTGLGLSLAYDIIKAQGGEVKVETKEGEGSEFIISLT